MRTPCSVIGYGERPSGMSRTTSISSGVSGIAPLSLQCICQNYVELSNGIAPLSLQCICQNYVKSIERRLDAASRLASIYRTAFGRCLSARVALSA